MKHIIITGASKGIGKALAETLAYANISLYLIARSDMSELKEKIEAKGADVSTINLDVANYSEIRAVMNEIFDDISQNDPEPEFIALINNVGMLSPIGPLGRIDDMELGQNIKVNLIAPLIFSNNFIKFAENFDIERRIINISSGAAKTAYYGWSGYCSSKAGVDMLTRVITVEQEELSGTSGIQVVGLYPGIVETDMQKMIRKQPKDNFIYVGKFIEYHRSNMTLSPEEAAKKIKDVLFLDFFPNGEIVDIRDF